MPDIDSYIREMQQKGYNMASIRDSLIRYGYPENVVDRAIYNVGNGEVKHTIHLGRSTLIAIVVIVIGALITAYFMFGNSSTPKKLLDVSVSPVESSVSTGKDASGEVTVTNMGSKGRFDVYLKYEIFDENLQNRIGFDSQQAALETTLSKVMKVKIPENTQPGNYVMQITARYGSEIAKGSATFSVKSEGAVVAKPSCTDGLKNQDEEDVDCGGSCKTCKACPKTCPTSGPDNIPYCDASTDFVCKERKVNKCGDGVCSDGETTANCPDDCEDRPIVVTNEWDNLERIKKLAESEPEQALSECNKIDPDFKDKCVQNVAETTKDAKVCDQIEDSMQKDRCFIDVAKSTNNKELCESVAKEDRKNNCYINFAIDGDYSVCDKITNPYLQKSCNSLKEASQ